MCKLYALFLIDLLHMSLIAIFSTYCGVDSTPAHATPMLSIEMEMLIRIIGLDRNRIENNSGSGGWAEESSRKGGCGER